MRLILLFVLSVLLPAGAGAATFVYVSVSGENRIAVYRMDGDTGRLSPQASVPVEGRPGSLGAGPKGRFLFAALRPANAIASFRIDPATGNLALIGTADTGENPSYVKTDRGGRYLFSSYYGAGKAAVHAIAEDGSLSRQAKQFLDTAPRAHSIVPDNSNRYVFVPHTAPNQIFQFLFDEKTSKLTPNSPAAVTTPETHQPRHIFFHPNNKTAYVSNEKGSSVTVYQMDPSSGALRAVQTLSTLPDGFSESNTCADVEVTPSGKFVYVSNRGHDSIAGYSVDADTGKLTALGQTPTEKTPRSFNIDPSSRFLYSAGQGSGKLASYRIDPESGRLDRFDTFVVGPSPAWVLTVETSP